MTYLCNGISERTIQDALWSKLRQDGHENMCPCYTPGDWWECDMFSVTKAGCMVEHEIKLSVADFRADSLKEKKVWNGKRGMDFAYDKINKRELLNAGDKRGPTRFFYVAPDGLLTLDMLPPWAGLVTVQRLRHGLHLFVARPAVKLHNEKVDPKVLSHLRGIYYWRFWNNRGVRDPGAPNDYDI